MTLRTAGSIGNNPRSSLTATLTGLLASWIAGTKASRKCSPGSGSVIGSAGSGPARTENSKLVSATVFAIGPAVTRRPYQAKPRLKGVRPIEGRRPTTLQKLAGLRSDPPMSLPSARGSISVASATAAPPLLPPAVLVGSYGFKVAPNTALKVFEPKPNSGMLLWPIKIAPALRMRAARALS